MHERDTVIVVGVGPVPLGNPNRIYAPGLRLFAFAKVLHQAGYRIIMGEAFFGEKDAPSSEPEEIEAFWERRFLPLDSLKAFHEISSWIERDKPRAIVSTTDVMNRALAMIPHPTPKWMDFFGHPMAERQEISSLYQTDDGLLDQWLYVLPALLTGDHFSTCSNPQMHALIGELGVVGRLNHHTSGHDLVSVLFPGTILHEQEADGRRAYRGVSVPEDAFCVLWNGGFNTWVDEKTLFEGMSLAMAESDRIHFILTGGEIKGHNETTFERFRERAASSPHAARFHFFGWVPLNDLPNFYKEADAAINIDRFTYEGILGCRNRVYSWMFFGIPILTTPLSENTHTLVERGLAVGFSIGKPRELAEALLKIARAPASFRDMAKRAKEHLLKECPYDKLLQPLLAWMEHPVIAPDREEKNLCSLEDDSLGTLKIPRNSLSFIHMDSLTRGVHLKHIGRRLEEAETEIRSLKAGRAYRWTNFLRKLF